MKKFAFVLTAAVLFTMLAGCAGGGATEAPGGSAGAETNAETNAETPKGTDAAPAGKTTVQFWHALGGGNGDFLNAMIQRFNESQDEIEVVGTFQGNYDETVTKLQQAVSAGTAPEIAMVERAYVELFADSDVLEDLAPYLSASGMSEADFTPGLMGHSTFNGKLVSLPLNRSTPIMHVNKTMLDENGLNVPTTWEEMKQVANALVQKENGEVTRYGLTMPYDTWYPIAMITQAKGTFFNAENTSVGFVDNGVGQKVFGYLKELQSTGALYYPPAQDSGSITNQMFAEGKVGMMFQSTGAIGGLQKSVAFDYVTAFLPADEVHANPTGGANVVVMSGAKNKDAAWKFIHWVMTDPGGAQQFVIDTGYLPFTTKMVESQAMKDLWAKEPNRKVAYDQLQYAIDTNKDVNWPEVMHEFFSAIEAIMYDNGDIASTLDTFKKEAERILAQ
ncbi:ABC transporter substrate-binding protein [Paenibacillus sp.]|uniref:ABC transporter substrate-binding protein n=1 Tax=Paenibacillus sp. TaxID=58172 RepID=UPI002D5591A1|nr:ABC transporter substrate-binding protein [Paenibacillus sp.]HZG85634.1 ABC transporter substrate-binding protein [Paenibacillus sp.]